MPLYAYYALDDRFCLLCRYTQRCPPLQVLHRYLPLHQQLPRPRALQPAQLQALQLHQLLPLLLLLSPAPQQPQVQMTAPQLRLLQRLPLPRPMTQTTL